MSLFRRWPVPDRIRIWISDGRAWEPDFQSGSALCYCGAAPSLSVVDSIVSSGITTRIVI